MNAPIVILGAGYTGKFLTTTLSTAARSYLCTSRNPAHNLLHVPEDHRLHFDLAQPSTWQNIPPGTDVLWCFPAAPLDLVQRFAREAQLSSRRIVVLGSTSAYVVASNSEDYPPPWIDETARIDLTKPRVQGEEFLREQGAIVLRVAGIYGPGRNPLDWIRSGRVVPSRKYVNLIHVEDLATICLSAIEKGQRGGTYNVSDGMPRTWEDISRKIPDATIPAASQSTDEAGKRILTAKLKTHLGFTPRYPDLFAALDYLDDRARLP